MSVRQLLVCPKCGRYPVYPEREVKEGRRKLVVYKCAVCGGRFIWKEGRWQPYVK